MDYLTTLKRIESITRYMRTQDGNLSVYDMSKCVKELSEAMDRMKTFL